jgi:hypothetical protein
MLGNPRKIILSNNQVFMGLLELFLLNFIIFLIFPKRRMKETANFISGKALKQLVAGDIPRSAAL